MQPILGISVDNAADVAREATDFVLMEKTPPYWLKELKDGKPLPCHEVPVHQHGIHFRKYDQHGSSSFLLPFLPMLPKQILLTNFITDFPIWRSVDTVNETVEKLGRWDMSLIRKYTIIFGIHSLLFDIITFFIVIYTGTEALSSRVVHRIPL